MKPRRNSRINAIAKGLMLALAAFAFALMLAGEFP
jgi:hypothetical protein